MNGSSQDIGINSIPNGPTGFEGSVGTCALGDRELPRGAPGWSFGDDVPHGAMVCGFSTVVQSPAASNAVLNEAMYPALTWEPLEEIEPLEDSSMRFDAVKGGGGKLSRRAIDDTPVPTREDFDDMAVDCEDCVNGRETSLVDVFGGDGKLARRQ